MKHDLVAQIVVAEFLASDYRMSVPGRVRRGERTQAECDANVAALASVVATLRFMAEHETIIREAIRASRVDAGRDTE